METLNSKKSVSNASYSVAILFAMLTILLNTIPQNTIVIFIALAIHFILFPVVANLPAVSWARVSGYAWLVIDNMVSVAQLNGADEQLVMSLRLGGHVFAAIWIVSVSLRGNTIMKIVGILLAIILGGYSLVAPWVPEWVLYPSMICWLFGFTFPGK
jgi:hypothetical protein